MSTTLLFLAPVGMLAVVWSLYFVGCHFPTTGESSPYSEAVLLDTNLVAYWPLNDLLNPLDVQGQTANANDLSGKGHTGAYTIPFPLTNSTQSQSFPVPAVKRGTSIVIGDANSSKNPLPASTDFEGGFVSIPWAANSADFTQFTVEAWVKPNLSGTALWVVFGAITPTTGFTLFIDGSSGTPIWQVAVGNGMANVTVPAPPVSVQNETTYVAVTCDGSGNISLWINPDSDTTAPPSPAWTAQNTGYVPIDMTQPATFFIGAGANDQPLRTQMNGAGAPLFPFQGEIQSVALYQAMVDPQELETHFSDGATTS
jgi:Concanavalin A-like lectin/glucanases superfamily